MREFNRCLGDWSVVVDSGEKRRRERETISRQTVQIQRAKRRNERWTLTRVCSGCALLVKISKTKKCSYKKGL